MLVKKSLILTLLLSLNFHDAWSDSVVPPPDPSQSIVFWKPHTITPGDDAGVALAQQIFINLLRAWDSSRIEPALYVVNSSSGPWAASLADGNILLSRDAIKACMDFGAQRAQHLLAFILSHELAHQRADDLWHQKFFRLLGNQMPDVRNRILGELKIDSQTITNVEQKEAQADHDGLIMMASVGYDPHQIIDQKDFFTAWVENIWANPCSDAQRPQTMNKACEQAQSRALRTRAQLKNVASQATLYELGTQAFVAGHFETARQYFTAYGRDYPTRAVYSSLGSTYLAQAIQIQEKIHHYNTTALKFYYPLLLDASPQAELIDPSASIPEKRGENSQLVAQLKQQRNQLLDTAISNFEKAIRLEPNHRKTYILLATNYLLAENTFMARGVIQGKYLPKFGTDNAASLIIAMTSALEGNLQQSLNEFGQLSARLDFNAVAANTIPNDVLIYASYYNNTVLLNSMGNHASATEKWKQLAHTANKNGSSLLFRLALSNLDTTQLSTTQKITTYPQLHHLRPGEALPTKLIHELSDSTEIWLEGEQLNLHSLNDGSKFVTSAKGKVTNAWQTYSKSANIEGIHIGDDADRPLHSFGVPTRRLNVITGEYLAYDDYGIAFHIMHNKIAGWFLY